MKVDLASNPADKIIDYSYDYDDPNGANNNNLIRTLTRDYLPKVSKVIDNAIFCQASLFFSNALA